MILDRKYHQSKVGRRMLAFFVLSALIPILFLAFLSYWESNRLLIEQTHARLDAASSAYNKSIYDRLLLTKQLFNATARRLENNQLPTNAYEQLGHNFLSLALISPTGNSTTIFGKKIGIGATNAAAKKHLFEGNVVLTTQQSSQGSKILMIRKQYPEAQESDLLVAEITPEYIWRDSDTFAQDVSLCIFNNNLAQLFCTLPLEADPMKQMPKELKQSRKGAFIWQQNNENHLANFQEIFLQAKFSEARWFVVATQPEADALGTMQKFNMIFWGSVVLAILIIMLLSMMQIRRVLVPLEKLIEGTRRLSHNDFTTKVDVNSTDEFGELATSFNTMSSRLGDQFETLTALSKIDQEILSGLNISIIAKDVLMHLQKMVSADTACISVFELDSPGSLQIYRVNRNRKQSPVKQQVLPDNTQQLLIANPEGTWITGELAHQLIQNNKDTTKTLHLFVLPLNWKDQMVGLISLGFPIEPTWQEDDIIRIRDYADRVAVALFTKNREEQLLQQARIDALTGLPNRFLFIEQLQKDIAQSQRVDRKLALIYIDLDRFKKINDSLGHAVGDTMLQKAGKRLSQCIRKGDTVARLGGDEFAIIINELDSDYHITKVAEKAVNALAEPFIINGETNNITASIGIAIYPQDGTNITDLMRNSDIAMYRAKDLDGDQYIFFKKSMNDEVIRRTTIERELRIAIAEKQFVNFYQPQVDPKTNKVRGVEALVRWNHPERGIVAPGYFIEIAEATGLITEIGYLVLEEACLQYKEWTTQGIQLEYVAVNVSVKQFQQAYFYQQVKTTLENNAMPAHSLELEITESLLMNDTQAIIEILKQLQKLGIKISIDDFGTGYSSMAYLEQLPFDTLKIDMSFVRSIKANGDGGTIAATIAAMAHSLNKKIVAEGVETQEQLDFLISQDCELIQGYFFSRPLPADELASFVNRQTSKVSKAA